MNPIPRSLTLLALSLLVSPSLAVEARAQGTTKREITLHDSPLWPAETAFTATLCMASLAKLISEGAKDGSKIHAETMISDLGALAGYAAQNAVRETFVKTGILPETGGRDLNAGAFIIVTAGGKTYYFGNLLNAYLARQGDIPHAPSANTTLYALVSAPVVKAGQTPLPQADIIALVTRTARRVGTADFGRPDLERVHMPRHLPLEALPRLWPRAVDILTHTPEQGARLDPGQWPMLFGDLAQQLIPQMAGVLEPATAMRIFFEAAVPASKVDLATLPVAPR